MVAGKWLKKNGNMVSPLIGNGSGRSAEVGDVKKEFLKSAKRIQDIWEKLDPVVFKEGDTSRDGKSKFAKPKSISVKRPQPSS